MADDDGEQPEVDAERPERVAQRHAGHDARQRDRQHHQEGHRLATEELEALHGQGSHGAEDERDAGRAQGRDDRVQEGLANRSIGCRPGKPLQGIVGDRPGLDPALVERIEHDHQQRQIDEEKDHAGRQPQSDSDEA